MVLKSHGPRRKTRDKFTGPSKLTVNKMVQNFAEGQKVALIISSNSQRGMPFRRFHGITGTVLEKRGRAYVVEIFDQNLKKKVIARPEHLKSV